MNESEDYLCTDEEVAEVKGFLDQMFRIKTKDEK